MFETLTAQERQDLGRQLGNILEAVFDVLAKLDGVTTQEAAESFIASYVATRIMEGGETDASE